MPGQTRSALLGCRLARARLSSAGCPGEESNERRPASSTGKSRARQGA